jgi:EpsI family protein
MNSRPHISGYFLGTLALLTCTFAASRLIAHRKGDVLVKPLDTIDRRIAGFTATDNPQLTDDVLAKLTPTSYLSRKYEKPGISADVFIAYYAQQRAGESMHSPKHCLPGAGWEIWDYGSVEISANRRRYKVNRYSISREGQKMVVLYWYQSKGRIIASEYMGKILLARDALLRNSTAAAIVRIIVPDQAGALDEAGALASSLIPQLQQSFGE